MLPTPQPARGVLAMQRVTVREVARRAFVSEQYTSRCLNGYQRPSAKFKAAVAAICALPEAALFRDDS